MANILLEIGETEKQKWEYSRIDACTTSIKKYIFCFSDKALYTKQDFNCDMILSNVGFEKW